MAHGGLPAAVRALADPSLPEAAGDCSTSLPPSYRAVHKSLEMAEDIDLGAPSRATGNAPAGAGVVCKGMGRSLWLLKR